MELAVLGVGRIGLMHARHAADCPAVDGVTVYDVDADRARSAAATVGARASSDLDEVLARSDGVLVATPTPVHEASVRAALTAGVPVLCEKPLATQPAVVRDLAAAADAAGVPLVVGFQRRFDPALRALREGIATGRYGTVYCARAVAADREPPPLEYIATSGGIFVDQLVHDLDALPWLLGEQVVTAHATGSVLVDQGFADAGDVEFAAVVLTFASGALGVLTAGRRNGGGYDNRVEVSAERGSLVAGLDARTPLTSLEPGAPAPGDPYDSFTSRWEAAYRAEVAAFAEIATGRADNPSPPLDSLHCLQVAAACARSLREGRPVAVAPDDADAGAGAGAAA